MAKKKEGEVRLAVAYVLLGAAVVALGIGLLYALIDTIAAADNDFNPGTVVFSTFLHDIVWTLMVSGILYGLYCLVAFAKEKSDLLDGGEGSE